MLTRGSKLVWPLVLSYGAAPSLLMVSYIKQFVVLKGKEVVFKVLVLNYSVPGKG